MEHKAIPFEKKILVCTNDTPGKSACCAARDGLEIFTALRQAAKERGVHPRIRVGQAKCLGQCAYGANVMIYPDNIWYSAVTMEDVAQIIDAHIPAE